MAGLSGLENPSYKIMEFVYLQMWDTIKKMEEKYE